MPSIEITTQDQVITTLDTPKLVIICFYKTAKSAPTILSRLASRVADQLTFANCDYGKCPWAESQFKIKTDPTIIAFKSGSEVQRLSMEELLSSVSQLITKYSSGAAGSSSASAAASSSSPAASSSTTSWLGAPTAQNFIDITDHVEKTSLDMLNADSSFGNARTLIDPSAPSSLKHQNSSNKDWVVSDTDEQLMLHLPFQTAVKLHAIQITSIIPTDIPDDVDEDEVPTRPRRIKIFANTSGILHFEEAEERTATQEVEIKDEDWDEKTKTVNLLTRFVKFQNCSGVTLFLVEGAREGAEKVRVDRIRLIGEKLYEKPDLMRMKQMDKEDKET